MCKPRFFKQSYIFMITTKVINLNGDAICLSKSIYFGYFIYLCILGYPLCAYLDF